MKIKIENQSTSNKNSIKLKINWENKNNTQNSNKNPKEINFYEYGPYRIEKIREMISLIPMILAVLIILTIVSFVFNQRSKLDGEYSIAKLNENVWYETAADDNNLYIKGKFCQSTGQECIVDVIKVHPDSVLYLESKPQLVIKNNKVVLLVLPANESPGLNQSILKEY